MMKAMIRMVPALMGALTLAGCAATSEPVRTPSGAIGHFIDCTDSENWNACYVKASELCGNPGYQVIDMRGDQVGSSWGSSSGFSTFSHPTRSMLVECN